MVVGAAAVVVSEEPNNSKPGMIVEIDVEVRVVEEWL